MSEKTEEGKQMENTSSIVTITTTTPGEGNNGNVKIPVKPQPSHCSHALRLGTGTRY